VSDERRWRTYSDVPSLVMALTNHGSADNKATRTNGNSEDGL